MKDFSGVNAERLETLLETYNKVRGLEGRIFDANEDLRAMVQEVGPDIMGDLDNLDIPNVQYWREVILAAIGRVLANERDRQEGKAQAPDPHVAAAREAYPALKRDIENQVRWLWVRAESGSDYARGPWEKLKEMLKEWGLDV